MGQKVHPYGFRLGVIRDSKSRWFAEGNQYRQNLIEDMKMRRYILEKLRDASISDVVIDRAADTATVTIQTAKPGIVIGRSGQDVDRLRRQLDAMTSMKVRVNVEETPDPDINAQLVAENVARQIERRVAYRRAMRQAVERAMRMGAQGIRMQVSGRLGGAEIARTEATSPEGRVPLQTLRADVEYGFAEAMTGYGHIGCKVWIYRGEIMPPRPRRKRAETEQVAAEQAAAEAAEADTESTGVDVGGDIAETQAPAAVAEAREADPLVDALAAPAEDNDSSEEASDADS